MERGVVMQGCVIRRGRPSYRLALYPAFAAYRTDEMMRTFWNLARKGPRASPAGSATSGRPPVHRSAVPSVPEDEPDADGSFQQTALYRPSALGGSSRGIPRLSFVQALSSHCGVAEVRVNHRQNIVAVDATTRKGLEELLAISELQSIPVTAKEPADLRTSTGYLHGADRGPEVGSLLPGLLSTMIVLSDTREGHTVTLLFGVPFPQSR
ncbi:hypothetical protein HPB51_005054 [Rhipicephalus microplus]|uniref:Uncharacterized protein n=1 Tax=Rhipicephalus microplus TaxID=6941 RepID=A0A9J6EY39_RHIMP|nr:hypothetical protein HPB51_005054 [Rhipicephalus microplus]